MSFLLHGLLIIALTTQLTTTEDLSELESTTSISISEGYTDNDNHTICLTQLQLVLLEEALIRVSLTEIEEENLEYLWGFLRNLNSRDGQIMEKIVKQSVEKNFIEASRYYGPAELSTCYESGFLKLLKFVNQSSKASWKLAGYQTLFNEITFNTTTNHTLSLFLNLQHYISQDELINTDAGFQTLLNNTEWIIDDLIQSSEKLESNYGGYDCGQPFVHFEYLIKRISSTHPNKIEQLWKDIISKEYSLEKLLDFVTELERNNRMNYTSLAISAIYGELHNIDYYRFTNRTCYLQRQLHAKLKTLPKNGHLRKLLAHNQFYIKNVYDQQYLDMAEKRIFMSSSRNSIWTVHISRYPANIEIYDKDGKKIGMKRCDIHEEWYLTGSDGSDSKWIIEIVDTDRFRFKSSAGGEYLRVGSKDKVTTSKLDENELSKFEWILEIIEISDFFDKDYECKVNDF
ncbi:hypothetical protein HA402_011715 [Bradysia odoriphaga]|nr:hypothetical protein HA402_011715 [Bradysia odoriphaga]